MTSKPLKCLKLDPLLLEKLKKRNINTCKDVLYFSQHEFRNFVGISDVRCMNLIDSVSKVCSPSSVTAYELYRRRQDNPTKGFFSTSLLLLDDVLQGGLPFGCITELAGPPCVGKTQFSLMLSLLATLPHSMGGLDGCVLYIDTEGAFSARRLTEMGRFKMLNQVRGQEKLVQLLGKIFVHHATTTKELIDVVSNVEKEVIRHNVKLIVLDSMASLFRKEYSADDKMNFINQNMILMEQAAVLKNVAKKFDIVVFVTNQITTKIASNDKLLNFDVEEEYEYNDELSSEQGVSKVNRSQNHVVPALGLAWSHCVTTRLVAQFVDTSKRQLFVVKSPISRNASVYYAVDQSGIVLTGNSVNELQETNPNIRTKSFKFEASDFRKFSK